MTARIHCDREGCGENYREDSPQLLTWHKTMSMDTDDDEVRHFCTLEHQIQQLAGFTVPESISKEGEAA